MQHAVYHHHRRDNGKEHNECINHGCRPYFLEIVFSEQRQEDGEAGNQNGCVQYLSHDVQTDLLLINVLALHLFLE